jgi:hypothetical protein
MTEPGRHPGAGRAGPWRAASTAAHTNPPQTRFMDFHEDPKLPAEAIPQIAEDARHARADSSAYARPSCTAPRRKGVLPARKARRKRYPPAPRRPRRAPQ